MDLPLFYQCFVPYHYTIKQDSQLALPLHILEQSEKYCFYLQSMIFGFAQYTALNVFELDFAFLQFQYSAMFCINLEKQDKVHS